MFDGKITFSTALDNSGVQEDLARLEREIRKYEGIISKATNAKFPLEKQSKELGDSLDAEKAKLHELKKEMEAVQMAMSPGSSPDAFLEAGIKRPELEVAIQAQEKKVSTLQKKWDSINDKADSYDLKIQQANTDIERATQKAQELNAQLATPSQIKMSQALEKADKSASRFGKRLLEIGKSALIFNLLSAGLRAAIKYMRAALKTNSQYTAQLAKLKGAVLTAFQPFYEFVLPVVTAVLRVLTAIASVIANVFSFLTGKTASQSAKNAQALNKQAAAIGGVGDAAEEASKQLLGFDEINRLESTQADAGSGGAGGGGGISPDFSDFDTESYKAKIDELTAYLSGALLALGAILAFSGVNIPLGIALMAAGAMGLVTVAAENWGAMEGNLRDSLYAVIAVLSPALLALGAVLAFSGTAVALGIGLMIAGLAGMGITRNVTWGALSQEIKDEITDIMIFMGTALLVVGSVLAFSGVNIMLGIAMMAIGAMEIATAASLNWDSIKNQLQGSFGGIFALVSGALLVLGAVLAFSGVALPLGIALIALGAAGLAGAASLNWNTVQDSLRGPLGSVTALISTFLLVLGILLCFTGVALPLGIALIAAGAVGLVSVTALNWDAMLDKLKEVWGNIHAWFSSTVAPYLTLSYWSNKFSAIGDGLKQSVKNGVSSAIDRFNDFISWINSAMSFSWGDVSLFGKTVIPAGSMQLLSINHIPHLAQGAVIPPNRKFMAVLGDQRNGTNIEAPLETIKQALAEVMAQYGAGDIQILFTGELAALGRVLAPVVTKAQRDNDRGMGR